MASSSSGARVPGALWVWVAILIFAAANSVVALLVSLGAEHAGGAAHNPITFCNVLFVGNLCAVLGLAVIFRKTWTRDTLARLTRGDWSSLVVLALLSSALAPALTFVALERTTVTNVVLVGRLEPPLFLALAALFLGDRPSRWTIVGAVVSLVGVALTLVLDAGGRLAIGGGELYAALGAAVLAGSTVISKTRLARIPLGIFSVFRTALGAVIFFVAATVLYGADHFAEAFSPFLWQWMLVYGLLVVVAGQLAWFTGIATATTDEVSLASSFSPVAGVLFALMLLGEVPGTAQLVGGGVILAGIALAQLGPRLARQPAPATDETPMVVESPDDRALVLPDLEQEGRTGFRGI